MRLPLHPSPPSNSPERPRRRRARLVVSLALVGSAVLVGCSSRRSGGHDQLAASFDELRAEIPKRVDDAGRVSRMTALADELERLLAESADARDAAARSLLALNANPDATRAQFDALLSETREGNRRRSSRALAIRNEAATLTDDATWTELERFRALALRASVGLAAEGGDSR